MNEEIQKTVISKEIWPIPEKLEGIGIFQNIVSQDSFNNIVGDPKNWSSILSNSYLFEKCILPNAIILFGKYWFDNIKWKKTIHRGVPFALFSDEDKFLSKSSNIPLEDLPYGRSIISKIKSKTEYSIKIYLQAKWYNGDFVKKPGGYIIDSIRNSLVKEIGNDLGFKLKSIPACPYCLGSKNKYNKSALTYHGSKSFSCSKCEELYINLETQYNENKDYKIKKEMEKVKIFKKFVGITCVCPSNECFGHFVPLSCVDGSLNWGNYKKEKFKEKMLILRKDNKKSNIPKNIYSLIIPPEEILDIPLVCPYCDTKFTPRKALKMKSGYKQQSGKLTGLPTISVWDKRTQIVLDDSLNGKFPFTKENIVNENNNNCNKIIYKQKIDILSNEVLIKMSRVNKNIFNGMLTWYFYYASICWMNRYNKDAVFYLFSNEKIIRGKEASIHHSFFNIWMDVLEKNISDFNKFGIEKLEDFKWFSRKPKFSGGPRSTFLTEVDSKKRILNKTSVVDLSSNKFVPRVAKVFSIYKVTDGKTDYSINYINDVKISEWQTIKILPNSSLEIGDNVLVECLIMSGHPTHSPFQRIIRFRKNILKNIITKIKEEEETGERDMLFWKNWDSKVKFANEKCNLKEIL